MRFVCDACQDITNIEADRMEIQGDKLMVYSRGRLVYVAERECAGAKCKAGYRTEDCGFSSKTADGL